MNKLKKYRIIKKQYFNERGKNLNSYYKVQEFISLFFGLLYYWKTITEPYYNGSTAIIFKTIEEAESFIQSVLCTNAPRNKWIYTPIKEIDCK